jgi:ABC-2 type transport system permease protein
MKLLTLWRLELLKLFTQRGAYAGFAVLASLSVLFVWGSWRHGPPGNVQSQVSDMFVMGGKLISAQSVCYWMLAIPVAMEVLVPLLIATISGGLIASEVKAGTLRTIMVRPVARISLTVAKTLTAWCHAILLCAFLLVFTFIVSYIAFGGGDILAAAGGKLTILSAHSAWWRLPLGYALAGVGMCAVASVALMLSALFENPLTAAGLTVAFLIVSGVLVTIDYFEFLKPYLLVTHLSVPSEAFHSAISWDAIESHLSYILPYVAVPPALTALVIARKDITC